MPSPSKAAQALPRRSGARWPGRPLPCGSRPVMSLPLLGLLASVDSAGAGQPPATGRAVPGASLPAPGPATALRRTLAIRRAHSEQPAAPARRAAAPVGAASATAGSVSVAGAAGSPSSGPGSAGSAAAQPGVAPAGFLARHGSRVASLTAAVARRFAAPAAGGSGSRPSTAGPVGSGQPSGSAGSGRSQAGSVAGGQSPASAGREGARVGQPSAACRRLVLLRAASRGPVWLRTVSRAPPQP